MRKVALILYYKYTEAFSACEADEIFFYYYDCVVNNYHCGKN